MMSNQIYDDLFLNKNDIADAFDIERSVLDDLNILYACYSVECQQGQCFVLYEDDGDIYEVNGAHSSYDDMAGQWEPEKTFLAALQKRKLDYPWLDLSLIWQKLKENKND